MTDSQPRILVVGVGSIGERHLRCFQAVGGQLGLVEAFAARRDETAERYGIADKFASLDEACRSEWDAAVICTPAHLHVDHAVQLAPHCQALLIEKPLATRAEDIPRLREAVGAKPVQIAYVYRSHPAVNAVKRLIEGGRTRPRTPVDDRVRSALSHVPPRLPRNLLQRSPHRRRRHSRRHDAHGRCGPLSRRSLRLDLRRLRPSSAAGRDGRGHRALHGPRERRKSDGVDRAQSVHGSERNANSSERRPRQREDLRAGTSLRPAAARRNGVDLERAASRRTRRPVQDAGPELLGDRRRASCAELLARRGAAHVAHQPGRARIGGPAAHRAPLVTNATRYEYQAVLHARPAEAAIGPTIVLRGRTLPTLDLRPDAALGGFAVTFEALEAAYSALPRMYFEPDGSFVWRSPADEASWQVDGMAYDRDGRVRYVELKGSCPPDRLAALTTPLGGAQQPVMFQLLREAVFLDEAAFWTYAASETR